MGILDAMRLDGKVAFITGSGRGIGYCLGIALAEAGADVAVVDLDYELAKEAAKNIAEITGSKTHAIQTDVSQETDVSHMLDEVLQTFGHLDIAICNAGICRNTPAKDMPLNEWNQVISINLTGVFLCAQAAGKIMLKQKSGSIINIASMSGHIVNVPQPQCAYNASKAAVIQLTKSLAIEWSTDNVRVNSISPGYIGTDLIMNAAQLQPLIGKWNAMAPLKRLGKPEELQAITVYLAGDTSSFTTGSDFIIDGAFTCI